MRRNLYKQLFGLYRKRVIKKKQRKKTYNYFGFLFLADIHVGFVLSATGPDRKTYTHQLMKKTVKSVISTFGYVNGKYSVIAHGKKVRSMGFNTGYSEFMFLNNVDSTPMDESRPCPALQKDLEETRKVFDHTKIDAGSKKVKYIVRK